MPTLTMTPHAIEEAFKAAIQSAGLTPPTDIIADGTIHRWSVSTKRGDKTGWYVLHLDDLPAGCFGDWRSGVDETWCAKSSQTMSTEERKAHRQRMEAIRKEREAEEKQRHAEAAKRAEQILEECEAQAAECEPPKHHPYCTAKKIDPSNFLVDRAGNLVVPVRDENFTLINLLRINAKGEKRFGASGFSMGTSRARHSGSKWPS